EQGLVSQTLTIPRSVCLIAGGSAETGPEQTTITVHAAKADANWPIIEAPFMRDNASTISFHRQLTVDADRLSYEQTTIVDIYGKRFDHIDQNVLTKEG
ncbi:MAG: hypothetical protein AAGE43_11670, partial [Pseudomonadota bacterium]